MPSLALRAEAGLTRDLPNPFDDVVASTVLGGVGFVEWVKQGFLEGQEANRDQPALTELSERPSIEAVRAAVDKEAVADPPAGKTHCLSVDRQRQMCSKEVEGPSPF